MKLKTYLIMGLIFTSTTLGAEDNLMSILVSQKTEGAIVEGETFEGEGIYSYLYGQKDYFGDSLGGYFSVGTTIKWDKGDVKHENTAYRYTLGNIGLTYTPIPNVTLLSGVGYGQALGKYYKKEYKRYDNGIKYTRTTTEKDKGINCNLGVNVKYKRVGIIAMYDSYPKVFSVGLSWNYQTFKHNPKPKKQREEKQSSSSLKGLGEAMVVGGAAILGLAGYAVYKGLTEPTPYRPNGIFDVEVISGAFLSTAVKDFKIEVQGIDDSNSYIHETEKRTHGLFGHMPTFTVPFGNYKLTATGYSEDDKIIFTIRDTFRISRGKIQYCTIDLGNNTITWRR